MSSKLRTLKRNVNRRNGTPEKNALSPKGTTGAPKGDGSSITLSAARRTTRRAAIAAAAQRAAQDQSQ